MKYFDDLNDFKIIEAENTDEFGVVLVKKNAGSTKIPLMQHISRSGGNNHEDHTRNSDHRCNVSKAQNGVNSNNVAIIGLAAALIIAFLLKKLLIG